MKHNNKLQVPSLKVKYSQLSQKVFQETMNMIASMPVSNITACRIRKIMKLVRPLYNQMSEDYLEEVHKPFEEKFKALGLPEGSPEKYSDEQNKIFESFHKEKLLAEIKFGEKEVEADVMPLGPQHLNEFQLSADQLESLGVFFDEEGHVREERFRSQLKVMPNTDPAS